MNQQEKQQICMNCYCLTYLVVIFDNTSTQFVHCILKYTVTDETFLAKIWKISGLEVIQFLREDHNDSSEVF